MSGTFSINILFGMPSDIKLNLYFSQINKIWHSTTSGLKIRSHGSNWNAKAVVNRDKYLHPNHSCAEPYIEQRNALVMQNKSSFPRSWKETKGSDLECFSQWCGGAESRSAVMLMALTQHSRGWSMCIKNGIHDGTKRPCWMSMVLLMGPHQQQAWAY